MMVQPPIIVEEVTDATHAMEEGGAAAEGTTLQQRSSVTTTTTKSDANNNRNLRVKLQQNQKYLSCCRFTFWILGLFFIIGGSIAAVVIRFTYKEYESVPTGNPDLTRSGREEVSLLNLKDGTYSCFFDIDYTFVVVKGDADGKTKTVYEGRDTIHLPSTSSEEECWKAIEERDKEYLASSNFEIYYNPNNPGSDNHYEEPLTPAQLATIVGVCNAIIGLFIIGLGCCVTHIILNKCCGLPPPEPYSHPNELMFRIGSRIVWSKGKDVLPPPTAITPPQVCTQQELDDIVKLCDPLSYIFYVESTCTCSVVTSSLFETTKTKTKLLGSRKVQPVLQSLNQQYPHLQFDIQPWKVVEGCQNGHEHIVTITRR